MCGVVHVLVSGRHLQPIRAHCQAWRISVVLLGISTFFTFKRRITRQTGELVSDWWCPDLDKSSIHLSIFECRWNGWVCDTVRHFTKLRVGTLTNQAWCKARYNEYGSGRPVVAPRGLVLLASQQYDSQWAIQLYYISPFQANVCIRSLLMTHLIRSGLPGTTQHWWSSQITDCRVSCRARGRCLSCDLISCNMLCWICFNSCTLHVSLSQLYCARQSWAACVSSL